MLQLNCGLVEGGAATLPPYTRRSARGLISRVALRLSPGYQGLSTERATGRAVGAEVGACHSTQSTHKFSASCHGEQAPPSVTTCIQAEDKFATRQSRQTCTCALRGFILLHSDRLWYPYDAQPPSRSRSTALFVIGIRTRVGRGLGAWEGLMLGLLEGACSRSIKIQEAHRQLISC